MVKVKERIKTAFEEGLTKGREARAFRAELRVEGLKARRAALLEQFKKEQTEAGKRKAVQLSKGRFQTFSEELGKAAGEFGKARRALRATEPGKRDPLTGKKRKRRVPARRVVRRQPVRRQPIRRRAIKRRARRRTDKRQPIREQEERFDPFSGGGFFGA